MTQCRHGNSLENCLTCCREAGPNLVDGGLRSAIRELAGSAMGADPRGSDIVELCTRLERDVELEHLLEAFCSALVINELQRDSIKEFARLVRHGARAIDIRVRKDGQECHFEADWLKQLFNPVRKP